MDKREQIARMAQTKEDEMLLARVYERMTNAAARSIPASTCFLSKREQMLAAELLRGQDIRFYGGPPMAEREICCYLPDYLDESWLESEDGPIAAVRASYFEGDTLTHRDFLGALMGCGVKRETIGDIYVAEGRCDFLVTREVLPYLLQNFLSAGRTKLHVERIVVPDVSVPEQKVRQIRDTVPSLRLDGIVSSGFSISRGKAAEYISAGKCELNYAPCVKGDKQTAEGDVITVRGLGKIRLDAVGGNTKKGRICVEITRFLYGASAMKKEDIDRINELARKAKTVGLTPEENEERAVLRRAYIDSVVGDLRQQLDNTYIVDSKGNKRKLRQ